MKVRGVEMLGVVVALALISQLVGFWFGRSQVISAIDAPATVIHTSTAVPDSVGEVSDLAEGTLRLYAGPTLSSPTLYTVDGNKVWIGANTSRPPIYILEGNRLLRSYSKEIQYTFKSRRIYRGGDTTSSAIYVIQDNRVYPGENTMDEPLLSFMGQRVYWGAGPTSDVALIAPINLEDNELLKFVLSVLLLERFEL